MFGVDRQNILLILIATALGVGVAIAIIVEPLVLLGAVGILVSLWICYRILRDPFFGVLAITFFLPFERVGAVEIGGMNVRIHQVLALVTLASWLGRKILKGKITFRPNPLFWPLFIFVLISLISFVNAINHQRAFLVFGFTVFVIIVSFMVAELIDNKKKMTSVARVLVLSAAFVSLFGIFQWVGDMVGLPSSITLIRMGWYDKNIVGMTRLHSTALEPLYFANYLLIVIPIVVGLILGYGKKEGTGDGVKGAGLDTSNQKPESKKAVEQIFPLWFLLGSALVMGLAFLLTMSRGGYLALAASLLVLLLFRFRRIFTSRVIILGLIVVGAVFGVLAVLSAGQSELSADWIVGRVTSFGETSADWERLETYSDATDAFFASPWLGLGIGNFGAYQTGIDSGSPDRGWGIVNNEYLELLTEVGLFGFLALAAALLIWGLRALSAIKDSKDITLKILLVCTLATMAGFCVQYMSFSTLYIMHIWFVIGMGVALQNLALVNTKESDK